MTAEVLLEAKNLSYLYPNSLGVQNISLELKRGQVLGLLGPNGAGKTSTIKMLSGMLSPRSGSIKIMGQLLNSASSALRRYLGYQPDHNILYPSLTVDENLDYALRLNAVAKELRQAQLATTKSLCGLGDSGHCLLKSLSKGMQQRVNIAQAIIHQPDIILFDEPTEGLDPIQIKSIRELIINLGKTSSIIISSHVLSEIEIICDSVAMINQGKLIYHGPLNAVKTHTDTEMVLVKFEKKPETALLKKIKTIIEITPKEDFGYVIQCHQRTQTTQDIIAIAMAKGWRITEIRPYSIPLEELFESMVKQQNTADHQT